MFELPALARRWLDGQLPDAEYLDELTAASGDATAVQDAVARLPDHPAKPLYEASATLYVAHVAAHRASMTHDDRDQVVLVARRLRELADRIFDRGHVLVDPDFGEDLGDVDLNLPEEVPDWVAEGLAPGPPLTDAPPPPPASTPPLRAATRPTEPEADWLAAVARAGAPERLDLDGDLRAQAKAYWDAAEALRDEPDPDVEGGRERSAVLRLSYLVEAEVAWAKALGLDDIADLVHAIAL